MFVLINLKAYNCASTKLAQIAVEVAERTGTHIGLAPQPAELSIVADAGIETWAQHVDPIGAGSYTGHIRPDSVAAAGATGTLLNHSERRLRLADIDAAIQAASSAELQTIVCANNPEQCRAVASLGPDAVAVEPPDLIGTGTPVSKADPDLVTASVEAVESVNSSIDILCGAGISTGEDVVAARELGTRGVLLASGVAKADDPQTALESLVSEL